MENYSLSDLRAAIGDGDGMGFGGGGMLLLVILFLFFFMGGRNPLGGESGALTRAEMQQGFDTQEITRKLDGITNGLSDGFYSQNTTMLNGFAGVTAAVENLPEVTAFVEEALSGISCGYKTQMQIGIAVEEIFVNIAQYAYAPSTGTVRVRAELSDSPLALTITFTDSGVPYDPLAKPDPDVTLSAEERRIGGLGIFMTKKAMDEVAYRFEDGKNIFTMKKIL